MKSATHGMTLVEVMMAVSILGMGILAVYGLNLGSMQQVRQSSERTCAKLGTLKALEAIQTVRFRKLSATDNDPANPWLLKGSYEIARTKTGASYPMPDCTTGLGTATMNGNAFTALPASNKNLTTVDGIAGCIVVEFPVPPLTPPRGSNRLHAGRLVFYNRESSFPTGTTSAFPFPVSFGLTKLDCDGDGAFTTTDLGAQDAGATNPLRLMPVRVSVDWQGTSNKGTGNGSAESLDTFTLLSYRGYD